MADIPARTEIGVTTGPIRGSRKIHVGPFRVAMRAIDLEPSAGEPPLNVYDTSGPYTDPEASIDIMAGLPALAAPAGFGPGGLPAGLQIIGPAQSDAAVLQIGHAYDQASGYARQRSPLLG